MNEEYPSSLSPEQQNKIAEELQEGLKRLRQKQQEEAQAAQDGP